MNNETALHSTVFLLTKKIGKYLWNTPSSSVFKSTWNILWGTATTSSCVKALRTHFDALSPKFLANEVGLMPRFHVLKYHDNGTCCARTLYYEVSTKQFVKCPVLSSLSLAVLTKEEKFQSIFLDFSFSIGYTSQVQPHKCAADLLKFLTLISVILPLSTLQHLLFLLLISPPHITPSPQTTHTRSFHFLFCSIHPAVYFAVPVHSLYCTDSTNISVT